VASDGMVFFVVSFAALSVPQAVSNDFKGFERKLPWLNWVMFRICKEKLNKTYEENFESR
jgi:hypothetical protein